MRRIKGLVFLAIAAMLVFGLVGSAFAAVGSDVQGTKYQTPVAQLSALGIVTGYEDGSIKPDQTITRAEFCAIAVRATNMKGNLTSAATKFPDVPASHWASGYISLAAGRGYVIGFDDGNFYPENPVTVAEAVTILTRILGYGPATDNNNWPDSFISKASEIGVLKGVTVNATSPAPRGDVFMMTANSLDIDIMKQVQYGTETIYEVQDDPSKTILSELFDIDVINEDWSNEKDKDLPVVNEVPMIDIGGMDANEIAFSNYNRATTYEVHSNFDPNAFLGQEVEIWVDEDEDFIYYIAASGNEEVLFEEIESLDVDGDVIYTDIGNDDYDVLSDAKVWLIGASDIDDWSDLADFDADALSDLALANVKIILNEDDDVSALVITDFYSDTNVDTDSGIVDEVAADDETIDYYNEDGDEDELNLEDEDYIIVKDGVPAELKDLAAGDVLNIITDDDAYYIVATSKQVAGACTDVRYSNESVQSTYDVFVEGTKYDLANSGAMKVVTFSDDDNDSIDTASNDDLLDLDGQQVTVYLDAQGNVRHVVAEESGTNKDLVGVVTEEAYLDAGKKISFTMLNKEGKEVTMTFDDDDVDLFDADGDEVDDPDFIEALALGNGRTVENNSMLVAFNYDLDKNGDLKEINLLAPKFVAVGDAELDEDDDTIKLGKGTYNVTKDTIIFDLTGDFDGEEIDDADVVTWDSLKDYDDNEDLIVGYTTDGSDAEYLFIIGPTNSNLAGGSTYYGLVKKLGSKNDEDVAYLVGPDGNEIVLNIDDANVAEYVYGNATNSLKLGDFIQYDLDASGNADDVYILARTGNVALDLAADLEAIDIDDADVATVKTSSSKSIKGINGDNEEMNYTLNAGTVIFQNFDTKQLKTVSGVSKGQVVLLIDTDDDGGAYDYVIILKDK